jgi:hypothetical protein
MNTRAFLLASLIGGASMAVLSNIPLVNLVNCLVCFWLWGSGILAVYLYNRFAKGETHASISQGLLIGLVAGLIGGLIGIFFGWFTKAATQQTILRLMQNQEMFGMVPKSLTTAGGPFSIFGLFTNFILFPFFGMVGGLIGGTIFKK